jgi:hypothetical protein
MAGGIEFRERLDLNSHSIENPCPTDSRGSVEGRRTAQAAHDKPYALTNVQKTVDTMATSPSIALVKQETVLAGEPGS